MFHQGIYKCHGVESGLSKGDNHSSHDKVKNNHGIRLRRAMRGTAFVR